MDTSMATSARSMARTHHKRRLEERAAPPVVVYDELGVWIPRRTDKTQKHQHLSCLMCSVRPVARRRTSVLGWYNIRQWQRRHGYSATCVQLLGLPAAATCRSGARCSAPLTCWPISIWP